MNAFKIILPIILLTGCSPKPIQNLPPCLSPPQTPIHKRISKAIEIIVPEHLKRYLYTVDGQSEEEDQLWNKVLLSSDSVYTQIAITNIYQKNESEREYYALEQIIDLRDTTLRQPVIEYQFVITPDTAFIRLADQQELRYTGIHFEKTYLLEGFAHKGNPEPEQYRWWSPKYGDVLIWYGEKRFLELTEPLPQDIQQRITLLKQKFQ